jgi:pimeloyl-ACP methyl ester carboxylesterase
VRSYKNFSVIFFILPFLIWGCANPMGSLEKDIKKFKKNYPNNLQVIESESRKVHYAWSGDRTKRPLIFVHGSPGSWEGWAKYLNHEKLQSQFHVIAVDRFGYGQSEKGKTERTLKGQADVIKAVLTTNESQLPAILVGHSYGGPVVVSSAINNPELSEGLLFIASSVDPKLEKTKWIQYPATWWPIRVLLPSFIRVCNEEIMSLKKELRLQTKLWSTIKAKVTVIQGDDDTLVPAGNADYIRKKVPKELLVSYQKIPKIGHFIIWQKPEFIIEEIFKLENQL